MSRKWERMVEKNRKNVNLKRRKSGQEQIGSSSEDLQTFKGRGWILPTVLIAFSVLYFVVFSNATPHDGLFWFTGFSYLGLGILMYLVRRPVIRIGKHSITARRYNGDRSVNAQEIEEIILSSSSVAIEFKQPNKRRWAYTKFQHRFPMDELTSKLKDFAQANKINVRQLDK